MNKSISNAAVVTMFFCIAVASANAAVGGTNPPPKRQVAPLTVLQLIEIYLGIPITIPITK